MLNFVNYIKGTLCPVIVDYISKDSFLSRKKLNYLLFSNSLRSISKA